MESILFLRSTDPRYDSRILRALDVFVLEEFKVEGVFWARTGNQKMNLEQVGEFDNFTKIAPFGKGIGNLFNQVLWQFFQAKKIMQSKAVIVYACDLDTFLVALVLKPFKKYKVVFDQFDPYESRFKNRAANVLIRTLERNLIRFADVYVVPTKNRVMRIHENTIVVPNVSTQQFSEESENFTRPYLFYGGVLSQDRGLHCAIDVISRRPNWTFVIAGFGELEEYIQALSLTNVIFLGKKFPSQILTLSANSSLILGTYDPSIPNNRNSASNKVNEAAIVNVPIVVAIGCGSEADVAEYRLGFTVEYSKGEDLDAVLTELEKVPWKSSGHLRDSYLNKFRWAEPSANLYQAVRSVVNNGKN